MRAAADLHVQALPVHVLQLPGARETRQQVSSRREPAGDAAADGRATVKAGKLQIVWEKIDWSLLTGASYLPPVVIFIRTEV